MKPRISRITINWSVTIPVHLRKGLELGDYIVIQKIRKVKIE